MRRGVVASGMLMLSILVPFAPVGAQDRDCLGNRGRQDLRVVGLTQDGRLICFSERDPGGAVTLGRVSGLAGDTRLVGIDFRPATGELFGLGDAGGLYVVDLRDGGVSLRSQLSVGLTGGAFGIDFNPTVDRLRVVSDTGQNLRINVDNGMATVDSALNPAPGTGVVAVAYTNNDGDGNTGTTLYGIDAAADQLVIQAPPNAGTLNATGRLTFDASTAAGFDIFSRLRARASNDAAAFASLVRSGRAGFYAVNLFAGRAVSRGAFRSQDQVVDIAISPR